MTSRVSNAALTLGVILALAFTSSESRALCRSTTERPPPDFDGSAGCWEGGRPLFWKNACVGFSMHAADGKKYKSADIAALLNKAAQTWTSAACNGGGHPSIEVRQLASTTVDTVEYKTGGPNVNLVIMRDAAWPHSAGDSLALTTLSFDSNTGEIFDGDIEINTADNNFALTDPIAADGLDLQTVLTHQMGHFLGFAHSAVEKSPMQPAYTPGSSDARALQADDVDTVCTVYGPTGARKTASGSVNADSCDPTPRGGLELTPTPPAEKGCGMSGGPSPTWSAAAALMSLTVLVGRLVRRRRPS